MNHKRFKWLPVLLLAAVLSTGAAAADRGEYCFAESDFGTDTALMDGIILTEVPTDPNSGLYLGQRLLRDGDVVLTEQLSQLVLRSGTRTAEVVFFPISQGHTSSAVALQVALGGKKDQPPTAENSSFETYKNIANTGALKAADPEGGPLSVTLVKEPKRGTVVFHEDGTFTYTPMKNKVGRDSFTYSAADAAGNHSGLATVTVEILKPTDRTTYSDMKGEPGEFLAMWMKEEKLLLGEKIAGVLCFSPEKEVTRGEFLAMAMKLLDAQPEKASLTSGFADEAETPDWMQPYIVAALKCGMITGVSSQDGLVFRPNTAVTRAEAAVMLQNALHLPLRQESQVFGEDSSVPVWAQSAFEALQCAGISVEPAFSAEALTREEAAKLLYQIAKLLESGSDLSLPWK